MADPQPMTADQALGPAPPSMTADEALGRAPMPILTHPLSGQAWDEYFTHSASGRVLGAFGQGAAEGWGTSNLGFSPEADEALKAAGIFNDTTKGQHSVIRSINEAVMRPAAAAADAAWRAGSALFRGGQAAVAQTGAEAGAPILGRDIAALPEAFMGEPFSLPGQIAAAPVMAPTIAAAKVAETAGGALIRAVRPATTLADVVNYRIGQGEGAYFGVTPPDQVQTPEAATAMARQQAEAAANANELGNVPATYAPGAVGPQVAGPMPTEVTATVPPPTDIHAAARRLAPDTFREYDTLTARRDQLRADIAAQQRTVEQNAAAQAPHAAEIADIQQRLPDATPRMRKKYEARLAEMQPEHDAFFESDQYALLTRPTPEMDAARAELQRTDYRMRDLAPDVTRAYREASEQFPEGETAPPARPGETPPPAAVVPEQAAVPAIAAEATAPQEPSPQPTLDERIRLAKAEGAAQEGTVLTETGIPVRGISGDIHLYRAIRAFTGDTFGPETSRALDWAIENGRYDLIQMYLDRIKRGDLEHAREHGLADVQARAERALEEAPEGRVSPQGAETAAPQEPPIEVSSPSEKMPSDTFPPTIGTRARILANGQWISGVIERDVGHLGPTEILRGSDGKAYRARWDAFVEEPPQVNIAQDVTQKLVAAGRPQAEAEAAAALVQAHYQARAERFGGALGTAEEMYARDAPEIAASATQPVREMAQGKQGKISLLKDGRKIITLLGKADASTFLHETGHAWLEELLQDAQHPQAPDGLKADASAVHNWLGTKEGETVPRGKHEKFARGFERYMMEGVAPTRALGRVFAQFRDWLTGIYQTVARLRAPITDDIRDVFDRLLATNVERTVHAPESPANAEASLHEVDAAHTPPERAEAAADQALVERRAVAAREDEATDARIRAERSAVAAGTGGEPVSNVQPPGPRPSGGEEGAVAEPPAVGAGGNQPAPKGGGVSGGAKQSAAEQPTFAAIPYPDAESRYVDKAGNIRLELLTDDMETRAALREMAERNNDFWEARGGVVSDAQIIDLANDINANAADLNIQKLRQMAVEDGVPLAARIRAGRQMLLQAEAAVRKAAAGEDPLAFIQAADRMNMIQETVSGVTAEWGRAGRAFRDMREQTAGARDIEAIISEASGRTLFQIQKMMKAVRRLKTPAQVAKATRDMARTGLFDWFQSAFVNWLLSGPLTHAGYTTALQMLALFRTGAESVTAAGIGALRQALGQTGERAHFGEIKPELFGLYHGSISGAKAAWDTLKLNEPQLPAEVQQFEQRLRSKGETLAGVTPVVKPGIIPNPTIGGKTLPVGSVIEAPSRAVMALHTFNWTTFYESSKAQQAAHIAIEEGHTGQALATRIANLIQNPTDKMMEKAAADAAGGSLLSHGAHGTPTNLIARLSNYGIQGIPTEIKLPGGRTLPLGTLRPGKFIAPFIEMAANLQRSAILRGTPLELFSQDVRDDLAFRNGGEAFDRTAGRIMAGSMLMIGGGALAARGLLNGSGPTGTPQQKVEWRRVNGMPHSVRIGNTSWDLMRLGTLGLKLSLAADLWQVAEHVTEGEFAKAAGYAVYSAGQNLLDESGLRGYSDLLHAVEDSDRYGQHYIWNFLSTAAVPYSVGMSQVAHMTDPYLRDARSLTDTMLAKIPGASETLYPRYDVWGQPIPNRGWLGTYNEPIQGDATDAALYKLGVYPAPAKREVMGVQLTPQQYDEYARTAGRMAKMRADALFGQPGFTAQLPGIQEKAAREVIEGAHKAAAGLLIMHYLNQPGDIAAQAKANKQLQMTTGRKSAE